MNELRLYMVLVGCRPEGRFTEQHDIFFGIAKNLAALKPVIKQFWKEAPEIHVDAWREVNIVDGYRITISEKRNDMSRKDQQLFFINLGGYRPNEFDEFHYKLITVAEDSSKAIRASKKTAFYLHTGFQGASSHVDDKYGVDVDDIFNIEEILSASYKDKYALQINKTDDHELDQLHLGYLKWEKM